MGQGEPLNAIISGNSDARVLQDAEVDGGLRNYFLCVLQALSAAVAFDVEHLVYHLHYFH